jgi:hypothetical protein
MPRASPSPGAINLRPVESNTTGMNGETIHAYAMTPEIMAHTAKKHFEAGID